MIPIVLLLTALFRPAAPTVGDRITIDFQQAVVLDPSPRFEIVSQRGSRVVIRTFEPRPFPISGRVGNVAFRNMMVPIRSVLKPRDNLAPAPLKPPIAEPYPRMPFVVIGIAALLAIAAWTAVFVLERRAARAKVIAPAIPPAERFRATVIALRDDRTARWRWARLADALRDYLAATTELSKDLTTRQLLERLGGAPAILPARAGEIAGAPLISEILRQGDLEKFSPWGARAGDFESLASRALELAPEEQLEEAAA
jgi:hypothetical protein